MSQTNSPIAAEVMTTLREKLDNWWKLSPELFGDIGGDIHGFEIYNYLYFLDNVKSLNDLIEGLRQLSPLANDALKVAESMDDKDFHKFKKSLSEKRCGKKSVMPKKYGALLVPKRFIATLPITEKCLISLGTALIRMVEFEEDKNWVNKNY